MFACIHGAGGRLRECASDFSPLVEETAPDTVVLDVGGLERLFGGPAELARAIAAHAAKLGLDASVAIANNPDATFHAACGFAGVSVIPAGAEAAFLAELPVQLLALSPDAAETLYRWGIRTFRDLAALPEGGLSERLGAEGVRLRKLARGQGDRPLVIENPPPAFEEAMELDYPVTLLEPLSFLLGRLLKDVCARLESHGLATHALRLRLQLENRTEHARTLQLPFPMRDSAAFLKLLQLDLDMHPPQAPVVGVAISAEPVNPRVVQHGLFIPLEPEPQKLELTLARIAKIVGEGNVGSAELLDTNRPGAFRIKRFTPGGSPPAKRVEKLALRMFRPPLEAKVQAPSGRPVRVSARGVYGQVVSYAGPWRSSGDWWDERAWSRDEWDVALGDGVLYRIYRDRVSGGWYVEGSYD